MIKINKNKNYTRKIIIILLMLSALYFSIIFFLNPSQHIYWMLPTENSVIIFSLIGIFISVLIIYTTLKIIFRKDAFLKIDKDGIFNGFSFYNNKFISWKEISRIESIKYNHNNYIGVFLKEPKNNEKGINYFLYKMNESTMGTAHIIFSGDLDCSFDELSKIIFEAWDKYKNDY